MKALAFFLCLVAPAAFGDAPSLGDVAKKEQERREKARKAGTSTRPLTEEDLASAKGTLASNPGGVDDGTAAGRGSARAPASRPSAVPDGRSARGEDYWRARAGDARARVAQAQRRLERLQLMIRFGQPEGHDANGRALIYSMYDMKKMADAAAAELAAAEAALEDVMEDGRRSGALPGWLR